MTLRFPFYTTERGNTGWENTSFGLVQYEVTMGQ